MDFFLQIHFLKIRDKIRASDKVKMIQIPSRKKHYTSVVILFRRLTSLLLPRRNPGAVAVRGQK